MRHTLQGISCEVDFHSASKYIFLLLWDMEDHRRVHKSPFTVASPVPIASRLHRHILFKIQCNALLSNRQRLCLSSDQLSLGFTAEICLKL